MTAFVTFSRAAKERTVCGPSSRYTHIKTAVWRAVRSGISLATEAIVTSFQSANAKVEERRDARIGLSTLDEVTAAAGDAEPDMSVVFSD